MPESGQTVSHYRIIEKLGGGGMGVVYKAEDFKLHRLVALKFLPEELSRDRHALERFEREAQAASALNHPNICTIYDIDEHEGQPFIAMELLEGRTLRSRIEEKAIAVDQILDVGMQAAEGLEAAHKKGIIHRDIKSANVFLTDEGRVKVLDFGLAKLLDRRRPTSSATAEAETAEGTLTSPGTAVGTVAYMSPEQALGEELDARTDLFSLGVLLYEMATGVLPFWGTTSTATLDAILHRAPTAPVRINPAVTVELERIINKALEKDRKLRYQSASDIRADLQRLMRDSDSNRPAAVASAVPRLGAIPTKWKLIVCGVVVVSVIALVVGLDLGGFRGRLFSSAGAPHIESLAVLPLDNLSGDPNQEAFTNGMTEALITELSKIRALKKVISRTSVMQYKGTRKPIRQIAGELGVDALIEGSALREGDRVRITVQVIDGATDAHLWADSFDREYKDILALHTEVARAIVRGVRAALSPDEASGPSGAKTVNPEAYDLYLRGRDYYLRGSRKEDHRIAIQMYEKAIQLDPGFALAYAALSEVHSVQWWLYYDRTQQRVSLAKDAAQKALWLQPELPETHRALGFLYYWCYLDYDQALREFEVVQRAMPNDPLTLWGVALILRRQGKVEESQSNLTRAIAVNPLSSELAVHAAYNCLMMRDLEGADRYCNIAIKLSPDTPLNATRAKARLRLAGDIAGARAILESARSSGQRADPFISYSRVLLDLYGGTVQEAIERLPSESWEVLEGRSTYIPKVLLQARLCREARNEQLARTFYESALKMTTAKIQQRPEEAFYHSTLGIAYAGLGRKQDAIREGKAGVELQRVSKDSVDGFQRVEELAGINAMVGEYDEAVRLLEYLMSIPGDLGVGALRLDPIWAPLRSNPRFQALIRKHSQ